MTPDIAETESPAGRVPPWQHLPEIPGGWTLRDIPVGEQAISLVLPATPDAFLDDPQVIEANRRDDYMPYWALLWPASISMSTALNHMDWAPGTEVLELGCGLGLVGVAAARRGWQVTFSDHDPVAVECSLVNAGQNDVRSRAKGLVLDWRQPVDDRRWPVILGCEVTYEARNHPILLDLLRQMLTPEGVCLFGDPGRLQAPRFMGLARSQGFRVRLLDASGQAVDREPGTEFQIMELRLPAE